MEARDGWRREVSHPSGAIIEIRADGPTNTGHFLEMRGYGIRSRPRHYSRDALIIWISVTSIDDHPVPQLDDLKRVGGPFFAQVKGVKGQTYESTALGQARKSIAYKISRSVYERQQKERKKRTIADAI